MHYVWSIVLSLIGVFLLIGGIAGFKSKNRKRSGVVSTLVIGIIALIWGISSWPSSSAALVSTKPPQNAINSSSATDGPPSNSTSVSPSQTSGPSADDIQWYNKNNKLPDQLSNGVGVGDSIMWVEQHDGKPSTVQVPVDKSGTGQDAYQGNNVQVSYMYGRTYFYEHDYGPNDEIGSIEAKAVATQMLPHDAVYTGKHYSSSVGGAQEQIYIYKSHQIEELWPATMFANKQGINEPGVVDVAYQYDTLNNPTKIMAVLVFISDNP